MPIGARRKPANDEEYACKIERILPFGVFVHLDDGTVGYIRRRELSLSGDAEGLVQFEIGQTIKAVVIQEASLGRSLELSLRRTLPDPWHEFVRLYQKGSVVEGVVKNLTSSGAYVEILPGVQGFVTLGELAPWSVSAPTDVVWTDDNVCAVITAIDSAQRRVRLSLRRYLDRSTLVQFVMDTVHGASAQVEIESELESGGLQPDVVEPMTLSAPILIVEDTAEIRRPLAKWLNDHGIEAAEAESSTAALELCSECRYSLVMADLDLPATNGAALIRTLRQRNVTVPIAIMSDPGFICEMLPELYRFNIAAVFPKPLDMRDVQELLSRLAQGDCPVLEAPQAEPDAPTDIASFDQAVRLARTHRRVDERLQECLRQIVKNTNATMGIIFHLHSAPRQISIVAHAGEAALQMEALYGLIESPVRDVIEEEAVILENHITREQHARFRKLLELLEFESCLAMPLYVAGRTQHALFLFQEREGGFSVYRQRDALATATLLAAILENQALDERLRDLSGILLSGQLAAGFGHEVHNRLTALDLQLLNLQGDVARIVREQGNIASDAGLAGVQLAIEHMIAVSDDLHRTASEFRKLMETRGNQAVDVNDELRQAELLLRPIARRAKVQLRLNLAENLPRVLGSDIGVQQIFLNVMLNGIQHTQQKQHDYRVLTVTTRCENTNDHPQIAVRVQDTGPGIHRQNWDQIFAFGFSTRKGGSGLGLYIAQSLINTMGGRISIESSVILVGTTFLVELPTAAGEGSQAP